MYCADIPGVPGQPYLISSTSTSVKFGWLPPIDNGGALITSYEIQRKWINEGESSWVSIANKTINELEHEDTGLTGTEDV